MTVASITSVNVKQAVPFFGVTNMEASLRFYVDGLGFKMKHWDSRPWGGQPADGCLGSSEGTAMLSVGKTTGSLVG